MASGRFSEHPLKTVDISAKMLSDVSRLLPLVKGAEKMKSLVLLLKRGVRSALSAFAVLNGTLLANTSASASVRIYALWYPSTNPGQGAVVANSGATIGGQFAVRVVVQPNSGSIITASVIHQSISEQTNAHAVRAGQLAEFEVASPSWFPRWMTTLPARSAIGANPPCR
jgi:hypothetical protein